MLAAVCVMFGLKTLMAYAIRGCGTHIFELHPSGKFRLVTESVSLERFAKFCALGGHSTDFPSLHHSYLISLKAKGRVSGCLASDTMHALCKGNGLFYYPTAKLRVLFEILPVGLLIREACGYAYVLTDGAFMSTSAVYATAQNDTAGILFGCRDTVQELVDISRVGMTLKMMTA
jgi:fructose-1,6-bisphosphatase